MRPRLSIHDLLTITAIVGVHLAIGPLAVANANNSWTMSVVGMPTLIAVWIHVRLRLNLVLATGTHYVVSLAWSFSYGLGYCVALNAHNAAHPTHGRRFLPLSWALDEVQGMALFGIITSMLYFVGGFAVAAVANCYSFTNATGRAGSNIG